MSDKVAPCCADELRSRKLTFIEMIKELHELFAGESDKVAIEDVEKTLLRYDSNPADWGKYALSDPHKYTRNLVDEGNGNFNLLLLVWGPGQESSIHDHTGSHCFMKNLEGTVQETRFEWPEKKGGTENEENGEMRQKGEPRQFGRNEVFYMSDQLGLHRVGNPTHTDRTVTLHLYSPPFDHCQVFDQRTSKADTVPMTFYSRYGQKE